MKNSYPLFIVEDIVELSNYLKRYFEFEVVFESDWYLQLLNGSQQIGIMKPNLENQPKFLHKKFEGQGFVLTIEVEDLVKYYKEFTAKEVLLEITTEEWGQTHFITQAPSGLIVDVVKYTEPEDYQ